MILPRVVPGTAALALAVVLGIAGRGDALSEPAESIASVDAYYEPDEARGSFEMKMQPYPIPVRTTTYVSFAFNLPEDLPELFHMVLGEVLPSKYPEHLHHFVLTGCTKKVDADLEGVALTDEQEEGIQRDCIAPMGGWAPGAALFGNTDTDTGLLWGRGLGYVAVLMNIHYTDGAYEDEATLTQKMAEDGIRVHYTPDFRRFTTKGISLMSVGTGPKAMVVKPGEPRFYITRTCKVDTSCKDISMDQLRPILGFLGRGNGALAAAAGGQEITCGSLKPLCGLGGDMGPWIQRFCPATCGFCSKTLEDGTANSLNPDSYRATGINYHAHLLGREMYTTLIRDGAGEAFATSDVKDTSIFKSAPETYVEDLNSQQFWIYDYQTTWPFEGEVDEKGVTLKGTHIKPGDRIQATCVYDSTQRDEDTRFSISTYDEMCITTLFVAFETPASLLNESDRFDADGIQLDLAAELNLHQFRCDEDDETDIYVGTLGPDEDGKEIWLKHPIEKAEGCTFPHSGLSPGQWQTRCPDDNVICKGLDMDDDALAGHSCTGGSLDQKDSNDGTTEVACVAGGGTWAAYTCKDAQFYLTNQAEASGASSDVAQFLVDNWWSPKCCKEADAGGSLICDTRDELLSDANAGHTCTGGNLDSKDSNDGTTEEECIKGGGAFLPYTCKDADDFLEHDAKMSGLDSATVQYLAENWFKPKCCDGAIVEDASGSLICAAEEELLVDANAGHTCTGGSLDTKDSNDGTTKEECIEGGGEYVPYSCAEADHFLKHDAKASGMGDAMVGFIAEYWFNAKCCGVASAEEETPVGEEISPAHSDEEEDPKGDSAEGGMKESAPETGLPAVESVYSSSPQLVAKSAVLATLAYAFVFTLL